LTNTTALESALEAFEAQKLDYLKLTDSAPILVEMCPFAEPLEEKVLQVLPRGKILKMADPKSNSKALILSPKFARHMHRLISRGEIPPVHIDIWMSLESGPFGSKKFNSGRYQPNPGTKFPVSYHAKGKTYQPISHTAPICVD
jgi:hypothetical protein